MNDDEQTPPDDEQDQAPDDEQGTGPADDDQEDDQDEDQDEDQAPDDEQADDEDHDGDTFPRSYVERLRARSAGYRTAAKESAARVGELERDLFTERVRALDVLADPADLPFTAELLDDPDALRDAVDALVRKSPHYRRRGTASARDTGSRERGDTRDTVSLTGIMRGHS